MYPVSRSSGVPCAALCAFPFCGADLCVGQRGRKCAEHRKANQTLGHSPRQHCAVPGVSTLNHQVDPVFGVFLMFFLCSVSFFFIVDMQAFDFEDGEMVVSAMNDTQFVRLANAVGLPEMATDSKYVV